MRPGCRRLWGRTCADPDEILDRASRTRDRVERGEQRPRVVLEGFGALSPAFSGTKNSGSQPSANSAAAPVAVVAGER